MKPDLNPMPHSEYMLGTSRLGIGGLTPILIILKGFISRLTSSAFKLSSSLSTRAGVVAAFSLYILSGRDAGTPLLDHLSGFTIKSVG
jgi:hypothetical protein